jgi:Tfp pilus assembly protein PilF
LECLINSPGGTGEAAAEYQRALALNPEFEPAIIHLAMSTFRKGDIGRLSVSTRGTFR